MQGAREYAGLFKTGQYGRLYLVSHSHARGKTFRIFALPANVVGIPNGPNAPLNTDAVEVYGVVSGHPGWTESYGWLYEGKWQQDFDKLVAERVEEIRQHKIATENRIIAKEKMESANKAKLLADY